MHVLKLHVLRFDISIHILDELWWYIAYQADVEVRVYTNIPDTAIYCCFWLARKPQYMIYHRRYF